MSNSNEASGGIGLAGAVFLVLLTLKLTHHLDDLSWWWVTAPLWLPPLAVLVIIAFAALICLCLGIELKRRDW